MPSSTLDVLNEWAQETRDDLIVEEQGGVFLVHAHLISERP
jgi:hypothetical protein